MSTLAPAGRTRRLGAWAAVIAAMVLVGVAGAVLGQMGQWSERAALDPESAGPDGARALARVAADRGIDVRVVRDRGAALAELGPDTTLVLPDAPALSEDALRDLAAGAGDVVLVEPRSATLDLLLPGSGTAGAAGEDPLPPDCALPAARRSGDIVAGALFTPGDGITGCYPSGDGFALLSDTVGGHTVSAVDGRALLANETVGREGNAALALSLLGARPTLVWYAPSVADTDAAAPPGLGELTPPWVTPAIVLLVVAAMCAAFWRGRRFGPLVAENLPVTVRASETTVGRAHLYARSGDAAHALEALRAPAIARISRLLGLGRYATATEVADAAAARVGADRVAVRAILVADSPAGDRALVDLDHRLRDLEARVRAAVSPEGSTP